MSMIGLPQSSGITCLFDYKDCTVDSWSNQVAGQPEFEVHGAIPTDDCVEFVGSNSSYAKLTYGGASGGNAANSTQCIRYVVMKNLSGVYANWKTVIGNETGDRYCSTIAMNSSGQIQFTRSDIYSSVSISEWHVVCWTSDSSTRYSTLWIDGVKIGTASNCYGWGADTYLCKGPTWGYSNNNTAFKCFILGDIIHSDSDILRNTEYLRVKYLVDNGWRISDGNIANKNFVPLPEKAMEKPYPKALWRIERGVNAGLPYNELLPDISAIHMTPLRREHVIRVYDISEPQSGFKSNGLAVLDCISCISHHDSDRWDIELTHPIDDFGKWKHLLVNNVLKIDGQLFRIDYNAPSLSAEGYVMTVHARHISQDMADRLITFGTFGGGTPQSFINWAMGAVVPNGGSSFYDHYSFSGSSDISAKLMGGEYINCTLLAALIGADNCLLNLTGGELYRDNFYFSVNERMEGARDDAFCLRYSLDMTEIKQEVDYSDFCTDLWCYDNWGNVWAVSYTPALGSRVHHPITRMQQFNYSEFEGSMERLMQDGYAYWLTVNTPLITYEVSIASLKNDPRYTDFLGLQDYDYGDSGTVYCPELDISTTQRIVSVEKNELTGDIISLRLGNLKKSVLRPTYMGSTISSGSSAADKQNRALQNQAMTKDIAGMEQFSLSALETREIRILEGQ